MLSRRCGGNFQPSSHYPPVPDRTHCSHTSRSHTTAKICFDSWLDDRVVLSPIAVFRGPHLPGMALGPPACLIAVQLPYRELCVDRMSAATTSKLLELE